MVHVTGRFPEGKVSWQSSVAVYEMIGRMGKEGEIKQG